MPTVYLAPSTMTLYELVYARSNTSHTQLLLPKSNVITAEVVNPGLIDREATAAKAFLMLSG